MKVIKSDEIEASNTMYFVYGQGGTGKTSLVKNHPADKKLVITFDSSHEVLKDSAGIDVLVPDMKELANMHNLLPDLIVQSVQQGYGVIMLDNVSNVSETILDTLKEQNKDGRMAYGQLQTWFRKLGQLMNIQPVDFYVTAWESVEQETIGLNEVTRYYPMMNQKARSMFLGLFDFVGRIHVDSDGNRVITTAPNEYTYSKNRLSDNEEFIATELWNQKEN